MKKFLITAAALMAFMFAAEAAQAATVQGEIKVIAYGQGMLIAPGIDCGSGHTDCTETKTWDDSGPAPTLSLFPHATKSGWGITSWSGCDSLPSMNDCRVAFPSSGTRTVFAYFFDVAAPSVFISGYSTAAGDSLHVDVQTSDNEAVTKVEFLINDEVLLTQTGNFGSAELDTTQIPEGEAVLKVRAYDANRNMGESNSHAIPVDHTAPEVSLESPLTATNDNTAVFTFDELGDDVWGVECAIQRVGENDELESCGDWEPYSEEVPTEGDWELVYEARDMVGNVTRAVHPFVVDRTAPEAAFTSGPADGAEIDPGQVDYSWSATDGLPTTMACSWDEGETTECDGSASSTLGAGFHSFKVVITDQAGNATTLTRAVTVRKPVDPDPNPTPDPDPDPGTADRTAPVIKLIAPKQNLRRAGKALRLRVRCDEACSGKVLVRGKRGVRFAGRVYLAEAGVARLKLKPTARVRKRLDSMSQRSLRPRPIRLTATASLKDAAGNVGRARLRFKVGA